MRLRAVLIDPTTQQISELRIPKNPLTLQSLRQLIGPNFDDPHI